MLQLYERVNARTFRDVHLRYMGTDLAMNTRTIDTAQRRRSVDELDYPNMQLTK